MKKERGFWGWYGIGEAPIRRIILQQVAAFVGGTLLGYVFGGGMVQRAFVVGISVAYLVCLGELINERTEN